VRDARWICTLIHERQIEYRFLKAKSRVLTKDLLLELEKCFWEMHDSNRGSITVGCYVGERAMIVVFVERFHG
jgi:hypothetical protein